MDSKFPFSCAFGSASSLVLWLQLVLSYKPQTFTAQGLRYNDQARPLVPGPRLRPGADGRFFEPYVALLFELESQLLAARLHDAAARQHVHVIRNDVVQQPLVVRDDDDAALGAPERVDAVRDYPERVDVEARVGLIHDGELRLQHRHLENLVALLLSARKAFVHRAVHQALVHFEQFDLVAHHRQEVHGVHFFEPPAPANGVQGRAQEVQVTDAGDLHRILEREKDALARAVFGRHGQQVLAFVLDLACGHHVNVAPGQHLGQRRLARAVRTHDGVDLALVHPKVHAAQDFVFSNSSMQILDLEKHSTLRLETRKSKSETRGSIRAATQTNSLPPPRTPA